MRFLIIILLSSTLLNGCSKRESAEKHNEVETQAIINKYNALSNWDSAGYDFTISYQHLIDDTIKPFKFEGYINDIFYSDSSFYLRLEKNASNVHIDEFLAEVRMTTIQYQRLNDDLNIEKKSKHGVFILKLKNVLPINPKIEIDNDNESSWYYYDYGNKSILFKGELIDFFIKEFE